MPFCYPIEFKEYIKQKKNNKIGLLIGKCLIISIIYEGNLINLFQPMVSTHVSSIIN